MKQASRFSYLQFWLMFMCLMLLGVYILYDNQYLQRVFIADSSYISAVIIIVFVLASCHAAWFLFQTSLRLDSVSAMVEEGAQSDGEEDTFPYKEAHSFTKTYLGKIESRKQAHKGDAAEQEASLALDVMADKLRNSGETGWYLVDVLIRLGLLGTIIGFVVVLSALSDGPAPTGDNIQELLISMSGGMGIALYTTLAGLICGSLLGVQHMILGRATEDLIGCLVDLKSDVLSGKHK